MTSQLKTKLAYKNGIKHTRQRLYNETEKHKNQVSWY